MEIRPAPEWTSLETDGLLAVLRAVFLSHQQQLARDGLASTAKDRRFAARQQPTKASSAVNLFAALSLDTESSTRTGSERSAGEIPVLVVAWSIAALE